MSVSLRSSGEREPKGHVYAEKETDCKARPETSWRGQQAGDSREPRTRQRKLGSQLQATRQEGLSTQGVGSPFVHSGLQQVARGPPLWEGTLLYTVC